MHCLVFGGGGYPAGVINHYFEVLWRCVCVVVTSDYRRGAMRRIVRSSLSLSHPWRNLHMG